MRAEPPSARQLRAQKDRRGFFILGGCAVLLVSGAAALTSARTHPRDQNTSCRHGEKPDLQTYVIVDRSDPWTETQTALLRAALSGIARSISTEDRLTLIPFDGSAAHPANPLFDRCKTPDASATNSAYQNPARAEKAHQENFLKPLEATIAAITKPSRAKETHLVAFLSDLAAQIQYEGGAAKTRIVIFSDMAENTPALSVYAKAKGQFTNQNFARYFTGRIRDHLSNIRTEIYLMPPPGRSPDIEKRIKTAWTYAFTSAALDFSIKEF